MKLNSNNFRGYKDDRRFIELNLMCYIYTTFIQCITANWTITQCLVFKISLGCWCVSYMCGQCETLYNNALQELYISSLFYFIMKFYALDTHVYWLFDQLLKKAYLRSADKVGRPFCFCSVFYFFKVCRQSRKTFLFLFCFFFFLLLFFFIFLYSHLRLLISPLFLNQSRWNLACW